MVLSHDLAVPVIIVSISDLGELYIEYSFSLADYSSYYVPYFVPSRQNGEQVDVKPIWKTRKSIPSTVSISKVMVLKLL